MIDEFIEHNPSFYDDPFFILPRRLPSDMNDNDDKQFDTVSDSEIFETATKLLDDFDEAFKELAK